MSKAILGADAELDIALPPTQDELPYDDGEPMESARHKHQMDLLITTLRLWLQDHPEGGYVAGNMFVYFSLAQIKTLDFRGPDVFVVLGVPPVERKSWVVWEEGKSPDVVIELLSNKTAAVDKGEKKTIYQNQLKVTEYFWFDPFSPEDLTGFYLMHGVYKELEPDDRGRLVSDRLGLALTRWRGVYDDIDTVWLRWETLAGELLPTPREQWEAEKQRADREAQRAEREAQRAAAAEAEITRLQALLAEQNADFASRKK